jgi:predicted DNA binding protein
MREFVFTITYDEGEDRLMDLLAASPESRSSALLCGLSAGCAWRLDRVTGPSDVVEEATTILTDDSYTGLSISERTCSLDKYSDVLEEVPGARVVYSYFDDIARCDSVPTITNRYVDGGFLFVVTSVGDAERWRVLMQDETKVGMLYDTLAASLRDGLTFNFDHLTPVTSSPMTPFESRSLRSEQRRVLEVAFEAGYYETPRETTLDDIADRLDWPRSTVSYRLRRAEAEVVAEFLSRP